MDPETLDKYKTCSNICKTTMKRIIENIQSGNILNTKDINIFGDNFIISECKGVYKGVKNKGVAFTTSIALNNCVSDYIYEKDNNNFNNIKNGDVVKIKLGVNIDGCIVMLGETIIYKTGLDSEGTGQRSTGYEKDERERYLELLEELSDKELFIKKQWKIIF